MKLRLFNLVSREEISSAAVPDADWKHVSAGASTFALVSRDGRAAAFRLAEDGEGCEPIPLPQSWQNLKSAHVSCLHDGHISACDIFGKVHFCTPDKADTARFSQGVQKAVSGCVLAVLTPEGRVWYRAYRSRYGTDAWTDTGWDGIADIAAGPGRLCGVTAEGDVQLLSFSAGSSGYFEPSPRALGRASAIADGWSGIYTLRDGRLCLNGRILGAGSDFIQLRCGVSTSLEFAVCRRKNGSFLTALTGGTFIPSSLTIPDADRVSVWDAGDRFLACLSDK